MRRLCGGTAPLRHTAAYARCMCRTCMCGIFRTCAAQASSAASSAAHVRHGTGTCATHWRWCCTAAPACGATHLCHTLALVLHSSPRLWCYTLVPHTGAGAAQQPPLVVPHTCATHWRWCCTAAPACGATHLCHTLALVLHSTPLPSPLALHSSMALAPQAARARCPTLIRPPDPPIDAAEGAPSCSAEHAPPTNAAHGIHGRRAIHGAIYTAQYTRRNIHGAIYTAQYTRRNIHGAIYTAQYTRRRVHGAIYGAFSTCRRMRQPVSVGCRVTGDCSHRLRCTLT
jgi:hypothetical protein